MYSWKIIHGKHKRITLQSLINLLHRARTHVKHSDSDLLRRLHSKRTAGAKLHGVKYRIFGKRTKRTRLV